MSEEEKETKLNVRLNSCNCSDAEHVSRAGAENGVERVRNRMNGSGTSKYTVGREREVA